MNILLTCILAVNLGIGSLLLIALVKARNVASLFYDFITPPKEGEHSAAALAGDALAIMFARAMAAQLKTTFMGMQSGLVRGQKALEGDIAEGIAEKSPLAMAAMTAFPALRKSLRRNPQLLDTAMQLLGGLSAKGSGSSPAGNGGKPKFNL